MAAYSIDAALQSLIDAQQPAAKAAGCFYHPLNGLTGLSGKVVCGRRQWLARRIPSSPIPFISRQREWRILHRLTASGLAPRALAINARWLLLEWLPGETLPPDRFSACQPDLVTLLTQLHRQPLSGYRLRLLPLLQHYWLQCRHRHPRWLRQLKRLARRGEPPPLRLGLLHMDIHPGNLLTQPAGLRLIDWEYAADGDVALELAAIIDGNGLNAAQGDALLAAYARANRIAPAALRRQAARWRPWLRLLMASWYQLRWEQSGDETLRQLAIDAWRQI
ncbi:MAG: thiamine kinase [Mixta calida]|uniref:thiamine kinase n=1 Tax=Mixta calida TaxID=665913 RepID=UPI0028A23647|nr:thiamine kinase [Mixta calida]MDU2734174.1 thiamine kinase [Mixta calida]MDU3076038.1 thiamine kinase [Mixta calida]MDU5769265.1 thiamine kinase [Mixta calida]MDU5828227.1 thiamine kinase [Mixta calida]